jgi:hypothetical protein
MIGKIANDQGALERRMGMIRKSCCLALLFLYACQREQFLPVSPSTNQFLEIPRALPAGTTPIAVGPTPSQERQATLTPIPLDQTASIPTALDAEDCGQAMFVGDVTIPDGTIMRAEVMFLKIWRIKNSGSCVWPANLSLVLLSGDPMGGEIEIPAQFFPEGLPLIASLGERAWAESRLIAVPPGESIDLPVFFLSPGMEGEYFSLWGLRSVESQQDLVQVYLEIRVAGLETPAPTNWGGAWVQLNSHADSEITRLSLEQQGVKVRGFFYSTEGELYLLEGGLFDQDTRVEGTFGPPYHDGYPFTLQLREDRRSFQGVYRDRFVAAGAWCGARSEAGLPGPCALGP